jgi:hypothetical protein
MAIAIPRPCSLTGWVCLAIATSNPPLPGLGGEEGVRASATVLRWKHLGSKGGDAEAPLRASGQGMLK